MSLVTCGADLSKMYTMQQRGLQHVYENVIVFALL